MRLLDVVYWMSDMVYFYVLLIGGIKLFDVVFIRLVLPMIKERMGY